jgi:hypothetical protein
MTENLLIFFGGMLLGHFLPYLLSLGQKKGDL